MKERYRESKQNATEVGSFQLAHVSWAPNEPANVCTRISIGFSPHHMSTHKKWKEKTNL